VPLQTVVEDVLAQRPGWSEQAEQEDGAGGPGIRAFAVGVTPPDNLVGRWPQVRAGGQSALRSTWLPRQRRGIGPVEASREAPGSDKKMPTPVSAREPDVRAGKQTALGVEAKGYSMSPDWPPSEAAARHRQMRIDLSR